MIILFYQWGKANWNEQTKPPDSVRVSTIMKFNDATGVAIEFVGLFEKSSENVSIFDDLL